MKIVSNDFKQEIAKLGREIDCKFSLHTNDKIITENGKFLMTQANQHLVVEQFDDTEVDEIITAEEIISVSILTRGKLLSTMMKELDFEVSKDLRIGDVIDCEFGVKVNDSYEYVNYGSYMVYSKEYNEDTKTFSYVAYDRMILTMQEVDDLTIIEDTMVGQAIISICTKVGLQTTTFPELPNLINEIAEDTFKDMQITYRDVLDMICQCLGVSMIVDGKQLKLKLLNDTIVDTFDETYLKDTNVSFGLKYGPVNSVVLSRSEDNDNIYRRDEESIEQNGLCEFKIKDNPILLLNDREDYIDEIFNQLNGLEYYPADFDSTGIVYLDWLDFYNIIIGDKTYKCLMLNDEIKVEQGLEETIYCEEPEQTETDYKTSAKTDKEVSFIVDKQRGQINAKVSKGDVINQINLDETGAEINADKISLAGKTIDLTGDEIIIDSTNFKVTKEGNITANNVELNSGIYKGGLDIVSTSAKKSFKVKSGNDDISIYDNNIFFNNGSRGTHDLAIDGNGIWFNGDQYDTKYYDGGLGMYERQGSNYTTVYPDGIYTPVVHQTSLEENKKDFEKLKSGLEIIKNIDIYKYHLKSQNEDEKKHIGFVIGNNYKYSKEITSNENNGTDIYSFISVCCKAIQEQQEQIETLKEEIKQLKESDK